MMDCALLEVHRAKGEGRREDVAANGETSARRRQSEGEHSPGVYYAATMSPHRQISQHESKAVERGRGVAQSFAGPALLGVGRAQGHALADVHAIVEDVGMRESDAADVRETERGESEGRTKESQRRGAELKWNCSRFRETSCTRCELMVD